MCDRDSDFFLESYESEAIDFDEAGKKVLAALNLDPDRKKGYNDLDPVWCHPETKASIYVGNITSASTLSILDSHKITHVVNCTDSLPNYFESNPKMTYYHFDINKCLYLRKRDPRDLPTLVFFQPMFDFVRATLDKGSPVLVHCLAGAHRAGTTGVSCVMHFGGFDAKTATRYSQMLRPEIDPFGYLGKLLLRFEEEREKAKGLV
jgi:predicted protein tyrosine phosphatase